MSDPFDHTFDRKLETKADEAREQPAHARRMELITGTVRRRDWSDDDKARIIVESLAPGANISAVARRHGLKPQQLFGWRREARELFRDCLDTAAARPSTGPSSMLPGTATKARLAVDVTTFAPVVVAPTVTAPASPAPPSASPRAGTSQGIEIAIGAVIVRVGARVDAETLAMVLAAVRRAS